MSWWHATLDEFVRDDGVRHLSDDGYVELRGYDRVLDLCPGCETLLDRGPHVVDELSEIARSGATEHRCISCGHEWVEVLS